MKKVITSSSNSKLLSVFWYIDGEFIGIDDTLNGNGVVTYGDNLQLDLDHFEIWDKISKEIGSDKEYDYYPRGRILFNTKRHKFLVIGDKKITEDPEVKSKLLEHYGLPSFTEFESDEHYQSYDDSKFIDVVDSCLYEVYTNYVNLGEVALDVDTVIDIVNEHIDMLIEDNSLDDVLVPENWYEVSSNYIQDHYNDYYWDKYDI